MKFEQFDHGADIGVRGLGDTPAEAFQGAASALFTLLSEDLSSVRPQVEERVVTEAGNLEELLVAFLNELIGLADARKLVFGKFAVEITGGGSEAYRLTARALGEAFNPDRHRYTVQPKGATYTALRVARDADWWIAQCVIDV